MSLPNYWFDLQQEEEDPPDYDERPPCRHIRRGLPCTCPGPDFSPRRIPHSKESKNVN